jgi:H+/gluconate symporter-like permease
MTSKNSQQTYFKYFVISAICTLAGLGTIVYVQILLPESEQQELLALIGLILSVPSAIIAFYCYIRLLVTRIQNFLDK